jgi:hypothetical protein
MLLTLAALSSAVPPVQSASIGEGHAIAGRLVAAIKGEADFQDQDFAKPLNGGDKAALRSFAACEIRRITNAGIPQPRGSRAFVPNPNDVVVTFNCEGVSERTPVGVTLHLENGKVAKIETHNADLMKADR